MLRLDRVLSQAGVMTRSQIKTACKKGEISVNGQVCFKEDFKIDEKKDTVCFLGEVLNLSPFRYIMLNKPLGVVSSTKDGDVTVIDILPEIMKKRGLFPCGRLDKDTVGLVIITDDGVSSHKRLSPKSKTEKTYLVNLADEVNKEDILNIENGVTLKDGYKTSPCKIEIIDNKSLYITLTEGKYHEIKRIFASVGNKVTYLKRLTFAGIKLDENLSEGLARYLTKEEENLFTK